MPTTEQQISSEIILSIWEEPLKSQELSQCFATLVRYVNENETATHILFDVTKAGTIPAQAPFLFIRSEMTKNSNLGRMAVIGTNPVAQILAQMAVKMSSQNILFFSSEADAMSYLRD